MNLVFIAAMGLAVWQGWDMGTTLSWTVPVTGVAQLAFTWVSARALGYGFGIGWPRWTPDLKRLAVIAGPAVLSGGVVQINMLVGRQVASFTEGAVAWLSYADRLYQLPLGVVGIAIGTVLLPELSRRLRAKDAEGGREAFNRGAEFALMMTVPAAVALMVLAVPLCQVLYQRGAFGVEDTKATALTLAIYGAGLPAFVLHKVLQPLFYAREDSRSPFVYALVSMVVNVGLAVGLLPVLGFSAAAWATTLSGWAMVGQLWWGSRKMAAEARFDARFIKRVPRIGLAAAIMGAALWAGQWAMATPLGMHLWRHFALLALCLIGIVAYFLAGILIGAFRLSDLRDLRRRPKV
jgi:putative peptidoglycan lipid II flippase